MAKEGQPKELPVGLPEQALSTAIIQIGTLRLTPELRRETLQGMPIPIPILDTFGEIAASLVPFGITGLDAVMFIPGRMIRWAEVSNGDEFKLHSQFIRSGGITPDQEKMASGFIFSYNGQLIVLLDHPESLTE